MRYAHIDTANIILRIVGTFALVISVFVGDVPFCIFGFAMMWWSYKP